MLFKDEKRDWLTKITSEFLTAADYKAAGLMKLEHFPFYYYYYFLKGQWGTCIWFQNLNKKELCDNKNLSFA